MLRMDIFDKLTESYRNHSISISEYADKVYELLAIERKEKCFTIFTRTHSVLIDSSVHEKFLSGKISKIHYVRYTVCNAGYDL